MPDWFGAAESPAAPPPDPTKPGIEAGPAEATPADAPPPGSGMSGSAAPDADLAPAGDLEPARGSASSTLESAATGDDQPAGSKPEPPQRRETGALPSWPTTERPARPARTSHLRSPLEDLADPAPRSVRLSFWVWIASCLPPLLAIILTLSRLTEVRAHLTATALAETPDLTAASLARIVTVTIWVAIAALAVPIVIEVALALVMVNRGNWARFVLPVVGLLALPAAVIAFDALSDETALTNHSNMIIGISVQAALVLTA
ncbi:MAG: hypothetical protein ABWZ98_16510, partial [Nakamurella sp.]